MFDQVIPKKEPSHLFIKGACVLLMAGSLAISVTGRGLLSFIPSIGALVFATEGLWGATTYDIPSLRRFTLFSSVFVVMSVAIGVVQFATIDEYCSVPSTQDDPEELQSCKEDARIYAWCLIGGSSLFIFVIVRMCFTIRR